MTDLTFTPVQFRPALSGGESWSCNKAATTEGKMRTKFFAVAILLLTGAVVAQADWVTMYE
jgi:hypothetical protein